jgi:hypothetical protein
MMYTVFEDMGEGPTLKHWRLIHYIWDGVLYRIFSLGIPLGEVHKQTGYSLIFNRTFTALGIIWWRDGEEDKTVPLHLTTASKHKHFFRQQCSY